MFEEYEKQYPPRHGDTRDLVQRVCSKNPEPNLPMKVKKENPKLYKELQRLAQDAGIRGETKEQWVRRLAEVKKPEHKRLDADEQIARDLNSEQEIDRILKNQGAGPDNLVAMRKSEPMKDYYVRLAAFSYGKLSNRPVKPQPETKVAAQESTFPLAPELCKTFNIKEGTHVTLTEFADLSIKNHEARKAEADRVAALTPPAEKVAE